ncbi:hypothetical protein [Sideroxydans sp. CL21]|jgi:hypothetical protein|uniref:hypothetical protein n=1 Tax=Sideroxydans sp. CL21 TaxID=2600596 RepID=UPI0024BC57CF|nr:hypothetical protein [Sideroxydans sp. CL21]
MNKEEITSIIENALKSGDKTPGIFDLAKIMAIKAEIQSCTTVNAVLGLIEEHRDLISKAFGLSEDVIEETVQKIRAIEG